MPAKIDNETAIRQLRARGSQDRLEQAEERTRGKTYRAFDKAVASLPDKAMAADDLDWIKAHPAMVRQVRMKDKTKDILLTVADVLTPPHGPAPSKAAVYQLQHWVNHVHEFWKQIIGEQKKKGAAKDGDGKAAEVDVGLDEIRDLLAEIA